MPIKVYIDQGHNPFGFNSGAEGNGLKEQDITYEVGNMLAEILKSDKRFSVLTSRTCPTQVMGYDNQSSLAERVWRANNWGADYFLSIHCNSADISQANGTEVYVYKSGSSAYYLADSIVNSICKMVGTRNRGVKINPAYYVLNHTTMPANLIELAFITNPEDAEKLKNDQYQFANAIYVGLVNYLF